MFAARMRHSLIATVLLGCFTPACVQTVWRARFTHNVNELDAVADMKLHLADGQVYVFSLWDVSETAVSGHGIRYDMDRNATVGDYSVPLQDVVLAEGDTAESVDDPSKTAGAVAGLVIGGFAAVCLALLVEAVRNFRFAPPVYSETF